MQMTAIKVLALALLGRECMGMNPLSEVVSLLDELSAKISKEGAAEASAYANYVKWCDDTSKDTGFDIETAEKQKATLEAKIGQLSAKIAASSAKIEELSSSIASDESDLADATTIRTKENGVFAASASELVASIDTLSRASTILSREMSKNPAAFAQMDTKSLDSTLQGLTAVLSAAAFPGEDQKRLSAFIQAQHKDESDDMEFGAPAAAVYKSHSNNILDVLEDLKEKAEGQLSDLRQAESNDKHNFDLLKQSLEDQISVDSKDNAKEKASKAASAQAKAGAVKDLDRTTKELGNAKSTLATAQATCQQVAADHEATVAARKEELSAIAEARGVLAETTSGAVSQTYSFTQTKSASSLRTRSDLAGSEVVDIVKRLAGAQHSAALSQLASRIKAAIRFSASSGADPFAKVKGLISDMIARLESEAGADATEKSYCDDETSRTEAKKAELEGDIARQTSKIDQATARSAQLKEEVGILTGELSALAKTQAEMDNIRSQTHADYVQAKDDLELGLTGVRKALTVLRDYYAGASAMLQSDSKQPASPELHSKSVGAGGSIVNILEVVESDFAKNLAKEEMVEADAQSEYERTTQENKVTKTLKDQDVKYKNQEAANADASATEYGSDRDASNTQYSAIMQYYTKLQERCVAKAETYESRKGRRAAEIEGLKQALAVLQDETAFVQRKGHGYIRGSMTA